MTTVPPPLHYRITQELSELPEGSQCMICYKDGSELFLRYNPALIDKTGSNFSCVRCLKEWLKTSTISCVMCQCPLSKYDVEMVNKTPALNLNQEQIEMLKEIGDNELKDLRLKLLNEQERLLEAKALLAQEQSKCIFPGLYDWGLYERNIKDIAFEVCFLKIQIYQRETVLLRREKYKNSSTAEIAKTSLIFATTLGLSVAGTILGNAFFSTAAQPEKGNYALMSLGSFIMGCFAVYHIADPVLELLHRVTGCRLGSFNPFIGLFPSLFVD